MKKIKKSVLTLFLCVLSLLCIGTGLAPALTTAHADTMSCSITVSSTTMMEILYEKSDICSQSDLDGAYDDIADFYYEKCMPRENFNITLELFADAVLDLNSFTFPSQFIIKLNGHTLTLDYRLSWQLQGGLQIIGDGGKIISNYSQSGAFACDGITTSVYIKDTTFENFDCGKYGIIYVLGTPYLEKFPDILIENCTFNNCHSTSYGGVIYTSYADELVLQNCSFTNCSSYYGGAVYMENIATRGSAYSLDAKNCTFTDCHADCHGGVLFIEDNYVYDGSVAEIQQFHFASSTIENCSAAYDGGAVYMNCDNGQLYFFRSVITNCSAGRYGGAAFETGGWNFTSWGEITYCSAKYGGGFYFEDSDSQLENITIHNCSAKKAGGAYYAECTTGTTGIIVKYCDFLNNTPANGNATLISEGSIPVILGIVAGVFLAAAIIFAVLFIKEKKKTRIKE